MFATNTCRAAAASACPHAAAATTEGSSWGRCANVPSSKRLLQLFAQSQSAPEQHLCWYVLRAMFSGGEEANIIVPWDRDIAYFACPDFQRMCSIALSSLVLWQGLLRCIALQI
jgi:hypothetical protein